MVSPLAFTGRSEGTVSADPDTFDAMKKEAHPRGNALSGRFIRIWVLFAGFYTLLALIGPNGLLPSFVWPDNNQHLLQVRAWLGEDIDVDKAHWAIDQAAWFIAAVETMSS